MIRPRTLAALARAREAGLPVIVVTGRMVQSAQRVIGAGWPDPIVCYQGAAVVDADGTWLLHHPIELGLAREAIAAVEVEGYGLNVYVDDELYVSKLTPEAERYASFQGIELHVVGELDSLARPSAHEARRDRRPGRARRPRREAAAAVLRPALDREVASVLPRARCVRRLEGVGARPFSPSGWASRRRGRSPSATARTIFELVDWGGYGVAVENADPRVKAIADWVCPPAARGGRGSGDRGASRLTVMIDLRAAREDPEGFRAALARKGAAERFDALMAADDALARARPGGRRAARRSRS